MSRYKSGIKERYLIFIAIHFKRNIDATSSVKVTFN